MKCPACLLEQDEGARGFTAAHGCVMAIGSGWRLADLCAEHREQARAVARAGRRGEVARLQSQVTALGRRPPPGGE